MRSLPKFTHGTLWGISAWVGAILLGKFRGEGTIFQGSIIQGKFSSGAIVLEPFISQQQNKFAMSNKFICNYHLNLTREKSFMKRYL